MNYERRVEIMFPSVQFCDLFGPEALLGSNARALPFLVIFHTSYLILYSDSQ